MIARRLKMGAVCSYYRMTPDAYRALTLADVSTLYDAMKEA